MKDVKDKSRFYIYKDVKEVTFPPDRVWKLWVPLPEAMFKGMWLQFTTADDAFSFAMLTPEEIQEALEELFKNDGGW